MDAMKPVPLVVWWDCEYFKWIDGKLVKFEPTMKAAGYFTPTYPKVKSLPPNWKG